MPTAPPCRRPAAAAAGCFLALALAALAGCSTEHYRESADREAYSIIAAKTRAVAGMDASFSLERPPDSPAAIEITEAARRENLKELALADAIVVAAGNNRDFLSRREDVYLEALGLTFQRYLFSPQFSGALSGLFEREEQGGTHERSVSGETGFGVSQTLATGANVGLKLSSTFLRFLTGDPRESAQSLLQLTITQPLARGAGQSVAQENLVQAERDMIYELRAFVQYRRGFFVSVARDYFSVLQAADVAENERVNLDNLTAARRRAEMLSEAGRLPGFQVDQTVQDELSARDRWVQAVQRHEEALENFKIELGLPPRIPLALDPSELEELRSADLPEFSHSRESAVRTALARRPDLANAEDAVDDAERKVTVAEDNLGPDVDLVLQAGIGTEPQTKPLKFMEDESSYSAGLNVDLPLDRLRERNQYRTALITLDRERRDCELQRDQVVQQVDSSWRKLEEARQRSEIQRLSVELARQRVESTSLLIDAGRAEMRDLLDAQSALLRALNAHSQTLVDYRMAALEMWRDMGVLSFRDGQFTEDTENATAPTEP